jgi:transcriptional regulator with XRE-family HTH domain
MTSLRDLRKQKQLTLAAVATATGINTGNLSRIERGEQFPNQTTASNLAAFFGISIGTVFDALPLGCANAQYGDKPNTSSEQTQGNGVSHG